MLLGALLFVDETLSVCHSPPQALFVGVEDFHQATEEHQTAVEGTREVKELLREAKECLDPRSGAPPWPGGSRPRRRGAAFCGGEVVLRGGEAVAVEVAVVEALDLVGAGPMASWNFSIQKYFPAVQRLVCVSRGSRSNDPRQRECSTASRNEGVSSPTLVEGMVFTLLRVYTNRPGSCPDHTGLDDGGNNDDDDIAISSRYHAKTAYTQREFHATHDLPDAAHGGWW